jgi:integrase/recombinase XerC
VAGRASLAELAEDWLTAKRAMESAAQAQKGNSDRARRGDLARWARLLAVVCGRDAVMPTDDGPAVWGRLSPADLTPENVVRAVAAAKASYAEATVARMLSHLRGWTRWLFRCGHLATDPCQDELLRARPTTLRRPRALTDEDFGELVAEARRPAPTGRMWWPARDGALLLFMAGSGARAEEVCQITVGEIDRRPERPIWRVNKSKGAKQRDVPLGARTMDALDAYLSERVEPAGTRESLPARPGDPLFVRVDGRPLTVNVVDRILRQLALRAGLTLPAGAAAHSLRHRYGVTLALRGVPQSAIAQLMGHADPRTTSIYTTVAATQLIGLLDDAGLL